ncbi:hypothetical protein ANCCAN_23421 [Ancylostoma caninum]|uniref:SCP domain-containing protein n=1 Tax=Ancylostoma caninum TaxID=29170 RepID=A0A368FKW6_ANCCA|nr:hypothetical protein ANCCAN_23421 [Ancylostoma caninum]
MRNLVFKEIMEKIKPKTPSYDCHLEYAALHKFSLNDEDFFRFVVGDVKYTHAMIFNKTMYWEDFQVADVKEAVNSWSETLKGIKDPKKFGCNYYEAEDHVTYIRRKVLVCLFN